MKMIRDLVHGYIELNDTDEELINTLSFQRLKDVRQLTLQHVYPGANHTRFEHSLGVMFLSRRAWSAIKSELIDKHGIDHDEFREISFQFSIASLLHDVGHAPFSHLGEKYYRPEEIRHKISQIIYDESLDIDIKIFSENGAPHELMSCYVILKNYINLLSEMDLEFILRCIIGNKYEDESRWVYNLAIQLLNSETIDIDKLDYLMRDAMMTGIDVPSIDIKRLFQNITIHPITRDICYTSQALPVIQNIIDSRDSLYLWGYNHHIAVYTDFIMEFYIKHLIDNHENKREVEDILDPMEFFSCDAVSNKLISDSDIWATMKRHVSYLIETFAY